MIKKLNLIYHIAPFKKNDVWKDNIRKLKRYLHVFDRKFVAISVGKPLHHPKLVINEFADPDIEFLIVKNKLNLKEFVSFVPLLKKVKSLAKDEATFYAHAKGVFCNRDIPHKNLAVACWRNMMYHYLLNDVDKMKDLLAKYKAVGFFRYIQEKYTQGAYWHYAGTFFWFR
jgi:hypothetical protein